MKEKPVKQNRKKQYTRMVLRDSLMELMKTRTISDISIKEICAAADISRSTFYAHYRDQYDLLQKTEEEILEAVNSIIKKHDYRDVRRGALQMVEEILQYIAGNNKSIQVLLSENGDINFQKKLFGSIYQKHVVTILDSRTTNERTREYYFMFIVNGSTGLIYHWIKNNMDTPVNELARLIINITKQIGR
ncbi:MAG: TetR/AcrR family transcriptional regulator [Treponema sp.]|jgi:AcrR family transcriptional regulator|nr:TetR/AcrR family transcriptional regulator [Treponema sp.]